jgi:hypothetical protein
LQAISELAAGGGFTGENAIEICRKFDTNVPRQAELPAIIHIAAGSGDYGVR